MARGKTDDEMLALSRANRMLEELEDPRARARVAHFLYLRFTAASEEILPVEDRVTPIQTEQRPVDRQLALPVSPGVPSVSATVPVAAPYTGATPPTPPTPAGGPATRHGPATAADGATATGPGEPGWNLSGAGSAADDVPLPGKQVQKAAPKKITEAADGSGWDFALSGDPNAEVEVKI